MDEPSVIRWALENDPDTLREYCWEEDGELHGDFARDFAQALRIEGTFKTQGKHAAGVVVSSIDLNNLCPMVKETRGNEKSRVWKWVILRLLVLSSSTSLGLIYLRKYMKHVGLSRFSLSSGLIRIHHITQSPHFLTKDYYELQRLYCFRL